MFYIVKYNEDDAAIYYDEGVVKETGEQYFSIESIPEGSGVLKTDGISKVWWEEIKPIDLSPYKDRKSEELSRKCQETIFFGQDIELLDGSTEHFEFKDQDQSNIKQLWDAIKDGATAYPYQSDTGSCKIYPAADIAKIYVTMSTTITSNITYYHQLKDYVNSLESVKEIEDVMWGQELTGEYLEHYNAMMAEANTQMQNIMSNLGATQ